MIPDSRFVQSVRLKGIPNGSEAFYPFCLPVVRTLGTIGFHPKVTFFVGENGTGKSTLLEAIAVNYGFNPEGGSRNFHFSTRETHSGLDRFISLSKGINKPRDSYFLRAESFYNVATNIEELDEEPGGGSLVIDSYGGKSLHEQSHGESFFSLFMHRFSGQGLYLLDEPEAALSPQRQLAFLVRLHELIGLGSQFIIATHSPLILAYPDAGIFQFSENGVEEVSYRDTVSFRLYNAFVSDPDEMIRKLGIPK